ncbi:MAG TPA: hypothetical protein DCZ95_03185 [Verrucomicrobia bacterium]|nr:MAG: hypothetical protein A2X46_06830 [Lentisphaerae bacterium GWF2_57_35]HBA83076.1 hypothetical protein [Verrucomicrobiota bacterium]
MYGAAQGLSWRGWGTFMTQDNDPLEKLHRLILRNLLFLWFSEGRLVPTEFLKDMTPTAKTKLLECARAMAEEFRYEPEKRAFLLSLGKD